MKRSDIIDILIIAWIVAVFILYHFQYLSLARTFIDVYATRYVPSLAPILSGWIP